MKTRLTILLIIIVSMILPMHVYSQSFLKEPDIRVGILSNQPNVVISADKDFFLVDNSTNSILFHFKANEKVVITADNEKLNVNGRTVAGTKLRIVFKINNDDTSTEVNRRKYRGEITIYQTPGKSGLTVVNTLPIEQYLFGVLPKEISPEWPEEAVKAQAVAARTYALYNFNKHKDDGYDVCATTDCQVYGGKDSEAPGALKAVAATYGEAIYYKDKLIPAYFHSASGGYTESSEAVWGGAYPYLQAVVDYDQKSPFFRWEKKFTVSEFEMALKKAGYNIGMLQAIELSALTKQPVNAFDRWVSGRVKEVRILGTMGNVDITGNKLRSILGLNSTLFDVEVITPIQKTIEFEITNSAGDHLNKEVGVNLPAHKQKNFLNDKAVTHRITGRANELIVISGFGWGHGVGMSQWGAKAMAETGPKGDTTYFRQILKHYYQGVDIKKAY